MMTREFKFLAVGIIVALLIIFFQFQVYAHDLGFNWAHTSGTNLELPYAKSSASAYASVIVNGAYNWDATPTKLAIWDSGNYTTAKIDFYTYYDAASSAWAETTWSFGGSGFTITNATIRINDATFPSLSTNMQKKVIAHEMGHAMGLADVNYYALYQSIMKQGTLSYYLPQSHDINDVNAKYP